MISTNDFRTGITIEIDGHPWTVVEFLHVKPGKGSAFVRTKVKNIITGVTLDKTFTAGERFPRARIERREVQYLYGLGDEYVFMDTSTYEQTTVMADTIGDNTLYLKENMNVHLLSFKEEIIGVDLPIFVELAVTQTDPGFRGDTATGGSKDAVLETGVVVKVPLFINHGDVLKIDTRTGAYIERVSN